MKCSESTNSVCACNVMVESTVSCRIISQRQYKRKIKRDRERDIPSYVTLERRRNSNGNCTGSRKRAPSVPPAKVPRGSGSSSNGVSVVSKTTFKLRAFEDGEQEDPELGSDICLVPSKHVFSSNVNPLVNVIILPICTELNFILHKHN